MVPDIKNKLRLMRKKPKNLNPPGGLNIVKCVGFQSISYDARMAWLRGPLKAITDYMTIVATEAGDG